jgi:hypothetical protein
MSEINKNTVKTSILGGILFFIGPIVFYLLSFPLSSIIPFSYWYGSEGFFEIFPLFRNPGSAGPYFSYNVALNAVLLSFILQTVVNFYSSTTFPEVSSYVPNTDFILKLKTQIKIVIGHLLGVLFVLIINKPYNLANQFYIVIIGIIFVAILNILFIFFSRNHEGLLNTLVGISTKKEDN